MGGITSAKVVPGLIRTMSWYDKRFDQRLSDDIGIPPSGIVVDDPDGSKLKGAGDNDDEWFGEAADRVTRDDDGVVV